MSWGIVRALASLVKEPTALAHTLKALMQSQMLRPDNAAKRAEDATDMPPPPPAKRHQAHPVECFPETLIQGRHRTSIAHQHWAWLSNMRMATYQPPEQTEANTTATKSAVKHDKAGVPIHLWNDRVAYLLGINTLTKQHCRAFDLLRRVMLRQWRRNVQHS
ncbi:hypothetical protein ACA910_005683 [Epithemia clementina (nom. ined.)]